MNIEQLQAMSDTELNELAAVKVMGWEINNEYNLDRSYYRIYYDGDKRLGNVDAYEWSPVKYIEDAMKLMDKMKVEHDHIGLYYSHCMGTTWTVTITDMHPPAEDDFPDVKEKSIEADTAPRAITIAAILAKGE